MVDDPTDDLDGLPPKFRAEYDALSLADRADFRPRYAQCAVDARATRDYFARVHGLLAESPPDLAGAQDLLGGAPAADLDAIRAELQRRYGLR